MASKRIWPVAAVTVLVTVAACSSGHSGSGAKPEFSTPAGKALTITPDQMLAATEGDTPVAYAKPEHGTITYGANGAMIYTPDAGFTGTDQLHLTSTPSVKLYTENLPPLTTIGGVAIQANAHGSAIAPVPGSSNEIYGLTDRGPNVAGRTPNEIVFPIPDFHPQIAKLKLDNGVASVERIITLAGKDGVPLVGLSPPLASFGESAVDINGAPLPPSDHGLDGEGLVALPDGTFWVSDEYGPFIVHFDANGKELERLSPFDGTLPKELSLRSPNQGLEGLTLTPDGTTLVAVMQSALQTPGLVGPSTSVPITRIVTIRLGNRSDVHEYLYPLANPQQTKVAVSEITAVSNTTFLIDELDGEPQPNGNKKIYLADISGATDVGPRAKVSGTSYQADRGGLLINNVPIETFVGISGVEAATDKLSGAGITVTGKKLKLDLTDLLGSLSAAGSFFGHAKLEGIITPDGGKTLFIANDSDFGLDGLASTTPPFALKPKLQPNGAQDSGEILTVDMGKLPPTMEAETIPIKVG
ncbi:esterase-like activity of phytase family protein [Mycobacterium sp. Aquia_213]|uniref:esterase-like activity of phytase family protein n=1 Tax=Mycobacterium sp. Aquia_213 TaxID=2991728 RepID=UPI00226D9170|nr:esterase-like activity of phytase family protein [Mycobacterium sp. Aquia_213]WAC92699.1 esterase-like activity of phytase family protein [Mycobacterium sp. Aquia_213]